MDDGFRPTDARLAELGELVATCRAFSADHTMTAYEMARTFFAAGDTKVITQRVLGAESAEVDDYT